MRALIIATLAGLAVASAAAAQPASSAHGANATLCLDTIGVNHPPVCHSQSASRFPSPPDICQCLGPWRQVEAPWCGPGEKAPAESADFEHARLDYAKSHHDSVIGGTYKGQSMCVKLGNGP